MAKVVKKCVVCGKEFYCESSRDIVTCSKECRLIHLSQTHTGLKRSEESKRRMSETRRANPRNTEIQRKLQKPQRTVRNPDGLKQTGRR